MSRHMKVLIVFAIVAFGAPAYAAFDTVGVYDPNDAPHYNQVDQSGVYDSHTENAGPENVVSLEAFQELIGPAFKADAGGVVDGEAQNGALEGENMIAKFGVNRTKSITFTNTSGTMNSGSSVKNNRRAVSGSARWAKSNTADFAFDISRVTGGGLPRESPISPAPSCTETTATSTRSSPPPSAAAALSPPSRT